MNDLNEQVKNVIAAGEKERDTRAAVKRFQEQAVEAFRLSARADASFLAGGLTVLYKKAEGRDRELLANTLRFLDRTFDIGLTDYVDLPES